MTEPVDKQPQQHLLLSINAEANPSAFLGLSPNV
jgi:hypothetical protein